MQFTFSFNSKGNMISMNHQNLNFVGNMHSSNVNLPMSIFSNISWNNNFTVNTSQFNNNFNFKMPSFNFSDILNVKIGNSRPKVNLDKEFLNKTKQVAQRIGCDYKDLLGVMNAESGLNSRAVNKRSGAVGLIQFLPSTAKSLGTSTQALANMSPTQQLDYVEKYLNNAKNISGLKGRNLTAGDLYALIFMPSKAKNEVLTSVGNRSYSANKGLDLNKDGCITKQELGAKVMKRHVDESIFA
ncbi:MAG: lytic transglycosylase domain-containing protein [Candidatus Gastranaerophilaceae bacterium]